MKHLKPFYRPMKSIHTLRMFAAALCFHSCAAHKPVTSTEAALPCFDAATELHYLRQHPNGVDTVLISMCGMDSCVGSYGRTIGLMDFLQQTFGLSAVSEAALKPEPRAKHRLLLNGSMRTVAVSGSTDRGRGHWLRTCSGQLFPAEIYESSGVLWTLHDVKHRVSMTDPLQLSRGAVLTYRFRYLDTAKLWQTDTLKLKLSRFDDRVQGRFARYHGQIQEPDVRYGTVDAAFTDEKTPSVLWLFPDEVCRPVPEGFEGSCRFLWLSQSTIQHWLQARRVAPFFFGTFSYPLGGMLLSTMEDQRLVHAYPIKIRGASTTVEASFLQFQGGSLRFLPCAGNPLVLSAATDEARLELIAVE
ncbi:MAG: hypothetical protein RL160_590 [Bacteroidota bacterium]|jgi:hypothetical protein